jgi:hypothetical protein
MDVNFDNLRITGARAFNRLVKELNRHVDGEHIMDRGIQEQDQFVVGDIYSEINTLRNVIATLLSLEDKDAGIKHIEYDLNVFPPDE